MSFVILCFNIYCLLLRSQHQLRFALQNSLNFFIGKCSFDCYWHYSSHNNPVKRGWLFLTLLSPTTSARLWDAVCFLAPYLALPHLRATRDNSNHWCLPIWVATTFSPPKLFGSYLLLLLLSQFHFCPFAAAEGYDGATSGCFIENTLKLICDVVRCRYVYLLLLFIFFATEVAINGYFYWVAWVLMFCADGLHAQCHNSSLPTPSFLIFPV